jgi:hypothetical protein
MFDGLSDCSFNQVVMPKTRVESEIPRFGLEIANVFCYQRGPVIRPIWLNVGFRYVVFRMYVLM